MKIIKKDQVKKEPQASPVFDGPVTMQTFVGPDMSKRFLIREVHFSRSARTKFHKHTIEQVLIITEGKGIVATEKEEVTVVPGDIIYIPAEEKHWHGAAKGSTFSHIYVMSPESKTTQLED